MNCKYPIVYWQWWAFIFVAVCAACPCAAVANFDTAVVKLSLMVQPATTHPCFSSLMGPPAGYCLPWQSNVYSMASFEPSRRLIFTGSSDSFLYVLDADSGKPFATIATVGRVVTRTMFNHDRSMLYIGTDKGVVYGLDAYSFARIFSFDADSKINNNLTEVGGALIFTSALGTIYSLNSLNGQLNWQKEQPLAKERLRLLENSNILALENIIKGDKTTYVIVPHADGYVSAINSQNGQVKKHVALSSTGTTDFPDIVAPMVVTNKLWVASYGLGIFAIDVSSARIRLHLPITEIAMLAADNSNLYAASSDAIFAIADNGQILWKNPISEIKSRAAPLGFPFNRLEQGSKRMFFGTPAGLLMTGDQLIIATSLGAIGIFDKAGGRLRQIIANSVGFGPLDWADTSSFMAVSKRGLLMKFQMVH